MSLAFARSVGYLGTDAGRDRNYRVTADDPAPIAVATRAASVHGERGHRTFESATDRRGIGQIGHHHLGTKPGQPLRRIRVDVTGQSAYGQAAVE